jgi:hypothetical protein
VPEPGQESPQLCTCVDVVLTLPLFTILTFDFVVAPIVLYFVIFLFINFA